MCIEEDESPSSFWNHRVMRHREKSRDGVEIVWYKIHEVYYNGDGTVYSWTKNGVEAFGDDLEELAEYLALMAEALKHPTLEYDAYEDTTLDSNSSYNSPSGTG